MDYARKDLREAYSEGYDDAMKIADQCHKHTAPVIQVSEVSRLLVNLRKRMMKDKFFNKEQFDVIDLTIDQTRKTLGLRKRSRSSL